MTRHLPARLAVVATLVLVVLALLSHVQAQKPASQAELLLGKALNLEDVSGNLKDAIATYEQVLKAPDATRAQRARAQFRIGACYERLGVDGARKAYELVVSQYGDQGEFAARARARLTGLGKPASAGGAPSTRAPNTRRVYISQEAFDYPSVSRDGRLLLLYSGDIQHVDSGVLQKFPRPAGVSSDGCAGVGTEKVWSPDGTRWAGSCSDKDNGRGLRVVNSRDGSGVTLAVSKDWSPQVHDWSPDGKQLLLRVLRSTPERFFEIGLFDLERMEYRRVHDLQKEGASSYPHAIRFSRDGRFMAFDLLKASDGVDRDIFVLPAAGGEPVAVVRDRSIDDMVDWSLDDTALVFLSDRGERYALWLAPVSNGRPAGPARLLKDNVGDIDASTARVTSRGIFYSAGASSRTVRVASVDLESGRVLQPPVIPGKVAGSEQDQPSWSPDGRYLAYVAFRIGERAGSGVRTLSVFDTETAETRHLSLPVYVSPIYRLSWLADSRWLVVNARPSEVSFAKAGTTSALRLMKVNVITSETAEITVCRNNCTVAADGKTVFDFAGTTFTRRDLESGAELELYRKPATSSPLFPACLSPDGRWLAFVEREQGRPERPSLKVVSTAGGPGRVIYAPEPPAGIHVSVGWSADSRRVLFMSQDTAWQVPIDQSAKPVRIDLGFSWLGKFTMHPDGKRLAFFTQEEQPSETWLLENFLPPAKSVAKPSAPAKK